MATLRYKGSCHDWAEKIYEALLGAGHMAITGNHLVSKGKQEALAFGKP